MPGKRAFAIGLCVYHSIASTVLFQTPRFIPHTFGSLLEGYISLSQLEEEEKLIHQNVRYKVTPEIVWGFLHGVLGLGMVIWWQGTVHYAALARKMQ